MTVSKSGNILNQDPAIDTSRKRRASRPLFSRQICMSDFMASMTSCNMDTAPNVLADDVVLFYSNRSTLWDKNASASAMGRRRGPPSGERRRRNRDAFTRSYELGCRVKSHSRSEDWSKHPNPETTGCSNCVASFVHF
jgi:hypothetical protein